jgi:hypothetical protein
VIVAEAPDFQAIYRWFNHWLKEPLNDREKLLIRETLHCLESPNDYARFKRAIPPSGAGVW